MIGVIMSHVSVCRCVHSPVCVLCTCCACLCVHVHMFGGCISVLCTVWVCGSKVLYMCVHRNVVNFSIEKKVYLFQIL